MMHTRICELLDIEFPIVGFTPSPAVAAAISRAGGMGVLGAVRYSNIEEMEEGLDFVEDNVNGNSWGLDVVMPMKYVGNDDLGDLDDMIPEQHRQFVADLMERFGVPELPDDVDQPEGITAWMHTFARQQVDAALNRPIKLLANALGSPPVDIIEEAHEHDILVAALAGKAKHARSHVDAGVDIVIAQGHEAGGHTGEVTTLVLVPEIVDAVGDVPVLAAGGIGTGRQIAASLALGADGVWMGSAWLTSKEFQEEPKQDSGYSIVKEKLFEATSSDTVRSRVISGKPARMLKTPWTEAWEAEDSPGTLPMPLQGRLVANAEARVRHHQNRPCLGTPVGQIVGQMNAEKPVSQIVDELVDEFRETMERMDKLR
jgi:NAD(P)H-dependent flavin oxidoreductase YrpB (nitropropane dioxygenase family)